MVWFKKKFELTRKKIEGKNPALNILEKKDVKISFSLNYETLIEYLKKEYYPEALEQVKSLIATDPYKFPDILIYLYKKLIKNEENQRLKFFIGQTYFANNQFFEAVNELEELIYQNKDYNYAYVLLRQIYNKNIALEKIQEIFEYAFNNGVLDSEVLELLQYIYLGNFEYKKSINFFEKLVNIYPNTLKYLRDLSELYLQNGNDYLAFKVFDKMLKVSSDTTLEITQKLEIIINRNFQNIEFREKLARLYFQICLPEKALNHIKILIKNNLNNIPLAIVLYKEALDLFPDNVDFLIALGNILCEIKEYSESVEYLKTAYEKNGDVEAILQILNIIISNCPNQVLALFLLADIYFGKNEYLESLKKLELLIDYDSDELDLLLQKISRCIATDDEKINIYAKFLQTKIAFAKKNYEQAIIDAKSLFTSSFDIKARQLIYKIYFVKSDFSATLKNIFETLNRYPFNSEIHADLKEINNYILEKDINKYLTEINENNKKSINLKNTFDLALLYLKKGDLEKALNYFQTLFTDDEFNTQSQILLGRCFMELSRYDLAINHFTRVLEQVKSTNIELANKSRYLVAMNYIQFGKIEKAIEYLENILEYDVNFPKIKFLLNKYKRQSFNNLHQAIACGCLSFFSEKEIAITAIISPSPSSQQNRIKHNYMNLSFSFTHASKGMENIIKENYQAAEDELNLAMQMDPTSVATFCNLALLKTLKKDFPEAKQYLQKAQQLDNKNDAIYLNLGFVNLVEGNLDLAINYFYKAIEINNNNYLAYLNLGDVYFKKGEISKAFNYWRKVSNELNLFHFLARRLSYLRSDYSGFETWLNDFEISLDKVLNQILINPELVEKSL